MAKYTTASELAEYVYCRRAWWLHRIQGHDPHNTSALRRGQGAHSRHGLRVTVARGMMRAGRLLVAAGILLILIILAVQLVA